MVRGDIAGKEGIGADAWTWKRKQPLGEERSRWREQLQRPEAGTNGPVRGKEEHVWLAQSQGRGSQEPPWQRSAEDRWRGALQERKESVDSRCLTESGLHGWNRPPWREGSSGRARVKLALVPAGRGSR